MEYVVDKIRPSDELVAVLDPDSSQAEGFRILRTNIMLRDFDRKIKVINIVSTSAQESKSTVILNLAYVFSQLGKKVLLMDLDLRLPSIHKKLRIKNTVGVADVVTGGVQFNDAVISYAENLDILLSGSKMPFSAEFVQSKALRNFISECRNHYDLIFVDCPPIGVVTDGIIVSQYCDGTLFVVASNKNEKRELKRAKDIIEQMKVNVIGTVVTRLPREKKYGYYNSNYSYGYTYSKKGEE